MSLLLRETLILQKVDVRKAFVKQSVDLMNALLTLTPRKGSSGENNSSNPAVWHDDSFQ